MKSQKRLKRIERKLDTLWELLSKETPKQQANCPHGLPVVDCVDCFRESDFQHECAQEARHFGGIRGRD